MNSHKVCWNLMMKMSCFACSRQNYTCYIVVCTISLRGKVGQHFAAQRRSGSLTALGMNSHKVKRIHSHDQNGCAMAVNNAISQQHCSTMTIRVHFTRALEALIEWSGHIGCEAGDSNPPRAARKIPPPPPFIFSAVWKRSLAAVKARSQPTVK